MEQVAFSTTTDRALCQNLLMEVNCVTQAKMHKTSLVEMEFKLKENSLTATALLVSTHSFLSTHYFYKH